MSEKENIGEEVIKEVKKTKTAKPKEDTVEQLKNELEELKKFIKENINQTQTVQVAPSLATRKVKVMSLVPNILNLTTASKGRGRQYTLPNYGYTMNIRFNDLEDIIHNHRTSVEKGYFYIMDRNAIIELGLEDEYEKIIDKKTMDIAAELKNEQAVDVFLSLSEESQETVVDIIVNNKKKGKDYNIYFFDRIARETKFDIEKILDTLQLAEDLTNKKK